jgi:hypothetical protein
MDIDLPYLSTNVDRQGNVRLYVRRGGEYIRIREKPGTPEFWTLTRPPWRGWT